MSSAEVRARVKLLLNHVSSILTTADVSNEESEVLLDLFEDLGSSRDSNAIHAQGVVREELLHRLGQRR